MNMAVVDDFQKRVHVYRKQFEYGSWCMMISRKKGGREAEQF